MPASEEMTDGVIPAKAGIQIRKSTPDDLPEIKLLLQECFPKRKVVVPETECLVFVTSPCLRGELEGGVISDATSSPFPAPTPTLPSKQGRKLEISALIFYRIAADECEILDICVKSENRRGGLASKLLEEVFRCAKEAGAEKFFLEVESGNTAAIQLYKKYGFTEAGLRKGYYRYNDGTSGDAIVMVKLHGHLSGD